MTTEKAIEILSGFGSGFGIINRYFPKEAEALDMAIKALKQEPCEDCISRQAVGYYIQSYIHEIITESGTDKNEHTNSILRAILNGIKTMPSVTPTRPTARWERLVDDFKKCSKCGRPVKLYRNYKHCPECGAKMQEVEEA